MKCLKLLGCEVTVKLEKEAASREGKRNDGKEVTMQNDMAEKGQ